MKVTEIEPITWFDPLAKHTARDHCFVTGCDRQAAQMVRGKEQVAVITLRLCRDHARAVVQRPENWQEVVKGV